MMEKKELGDNIAIFSRCVFDIFVKNKVKKNSVSYVFIFIKNKNKEIYTIHEFLRRTFV